MWSKEQAWPNLYRSQVGVRDILAKYDLDYLISVQFVQIYYCCYL